MNKIWHPSSFSFILCSRANSKCRLIFISNLCTFHPNNFHSNFLSNYLFSLSVTLSIFLYLILFDFLNFHFCSPIIHSLTLNLFLQKCNLSLKILFFRKILSIYCYPFLFYIKKINKFNYNKI